MDPEGGVVAQPRGRDVAGFKAMAGKVNEYLTLKAIESPTTANKVDLLIVELEFGNVALADAKARLGALAGDMSDEQQAKAEAGLKRLEQGEVDKLIMQTLQEKKPQSQEAAAEVGKVFYEMYQEGKTPSSPQTAQYFWPMIMEHGYAAKSVEIFKVGLGELKKAFGDNPRAAQFFQQQEARLKELESAGSK